jgi:SDR family mycofactocin-dependent oxidoreductase
VSRVAIVTGAARGIGAATVVQLAREGWTVLAVDRGAQDPRLSYPLGSEQELRAVAARAPGAVEAVLADVAEQEALERVVQTAVTRHGGLDAFIAAAGVIAGGVPQWELEPQRERAVFEVCLHAVALAARVAIPALLARPEPRAGRFLAVSSSAGVRPRPLLAAYSAAKAGVVALVQALALELRGAGVTANAVCPGSTRTSMLEESARLYGVAGAEEFARQQPLERLIEPEEVAATLVWLAGKHGAAITGAAVTVDGGLSL